MQSGWQAHKRTSQRDIHNKTRAKTAAAGSHSLQSAKAPLNILVIASHVCSRAAGARAHRHVCSEWMSDTEVKAYLCTTHLTASSKVHGVRFKARMWHASKAGTCSFLRLLREDWQAVR